MSNIKTTLNRLTYAIEETDELISLVGTKNPDDEYALHLANLIRYDIIAAAEKFDYFLATDHGITPSTAKPHAVHEILLDLNEADNTATRILHRIRLNGPQPEVDAATSFVLTDLLQSIKQQIEALTPEDLTPTYLTEK